MKIKVKRKTKLMIVKKVINKNFCFLLITGKQKVLSGIFGKNSVLHISFFKYLINMDYMLRYSYSYVCIFNFKDFVQEENYFHFFNEPDLLIHLAWEGLPNYKSLFHFEENLPGHYAFLKNLITHGLSDITVTGTCLEYGLKEGKLSEDMVTNPSNSYAIAKDTLRKFLEQLQSVQPFHLKWVRLFYMYAQY